MVRVQIVDDHAVMRDGLRELIARESDFEVVGESMNATQALAQFRELRPDVAIVDISLGQQNGLTLVHDLRELSTDVKILVLSMHDELVFAERALRAGANGYVTKDQNATVILSALRRIMTGRTWVSDAVGERIFQGLSVPPGRRQSHSRLDRLSNRELEILTLLGQGHTTRSIATALSVSAKTVETHRAHLKEKLGLASGHELVRVAVSWARDGYFDSTG